MLPHGTVQNYDPKASVNNQNKAWYITEKGNTEVTIICQASISQEPIHKMNPEDYWPAPSQYAECMKAAKMLNPNASQKHIDLKILYYAKTICYKSIFNFNILCITFWINSCYT